MKSVSASASCDGELDVQPNVPESQITQLLNEQYGFNVVSLQPLYGYTDQNLRVIVDHIRNPHIETICHHGYLVKVSSLFESKWPDLLSSQRDLMDHLSQRGIPCQVPVRNIHGHLLTDLPRGRHFSEPEAIHKVSVREYLEGQVLSHVTLTASNVYQLGRFVASLTLALQDLTLPSCAAHNHTWSIDNAPRVRGILHNYVRERSRRRMCQDILDLFETKVGPVEHRLRRAQLHGDVNTDNLLISNEDASKSPLDKLSITGLLDYGDIHTSYRISEGTNCAAYLLTNDYHDTSQLDSIGHFLAGYCSVLDMDAAEREVYHILIAARLTQSVVLNEQTCKYDPQNDLVRTSAEQEWSALDMLWNAPLLAARERWEGIMSGYS